MSKHAPITEMVPPFSITSAWEWRPLGSAISQRKTWTDVEDTRKYRRVTVQLHGRGIVPRDEVYGTKIKTKRQQIVRGGDLLVAEIDAKMGGFGIVPAELDGGVVSSHYFTFEIDEAHLMREFLSLAISAGHLTEGIRKAVRGSLNYAAIRPRHVLGLAFPFPPREGQEALVNRAAAARRAARAAQEAADALRVLPTALFRDAMLNGT